MGSRNYAELSRLHERYSKYGLRILIFPSNQFGHLSPGKNADMKQFLHTKGDFEFFSKIDVNGKHTHPLYVFLKNKKRGYTGGFIEWNFCKFLCNKHGKPIQRYGPWRFPLVQADEEIRMALLTKGRMEIYRELKS